MRTVYAVSGGVSKFAKARPDKTFQAVVKEAYDYAINDLGLDFEQFTEAARLVGLYWLSLNQPPLLGKPGGPGS